MQSETAVACIAVTERLAAAADGEAELARDERDHLDRCLRCQAEEAQYRRLMRAMRAMRNAPVGVDAGLEYEILACIDRAGDRAALVSSRAAAAIGGLAAGAAAAAGMFVLASRQRRLAS